ncbi:hypothetical protein DFH27DRAFT_40912 [Peziza echinospora]|nr:hypothetical protein DFH27DRAFT_40912 [Peziza echinospora]
MCLIHHVIPFLSHFIAFRCVFQFCLLVFDSMFWKFRQTCNSNSALSLPDSSPSMITCMCVLYCIPLAITPINSNSNFNIQRWPWMGYMLINRT